MYMTMFYLHIRGFTFPSTIVWSLSKAITSDMVHFIALLLTG
jgi:hypothetical protein